VYRPPPRTLMCFLEVSVVSNSAFARMNTQYNNISTMLRTATNGSKLDIDQLLENIDDFGDTLKKLFFLSMEKNNRLKNKLVELKVPAHEIASLLSDDLSIMDEMVPFDGFAIYSKFCKAEYVEHWDCMEEKTRKFLVTSYYLFNTIMTTHMDYSPVVIELAKSIEEEMSTKLYYDFILKCSRQPTQKIKDFDNKLEEAVFNYRKDVTAYYVPLSTMFDALMPSQRLKSNIYYQMLQQKLTDEKWDTSTLCSKQFVDKGKDYAKNCRNAAAHSAALTEEKAQECMDKTKELLSEFLSAYNP